MYLPFMIQTLVYLSSLDTCTWFYILFYFYINTYKDYTCTCKIHYFCQRQQYGHWWQALLEF